MCKWIFLALTLGAAVATLVLYTISLDAYDHHSGMGPIATMTTLFLWVLPAACATALFGLVAIVCALLDRLKKIRPA